MPKITKKLDGASRAREMKMDIDENSLIFCLDRIQWVPYDAVFRLR